MVWMAGDEPGGATRGPFLNDLGSGLAAGTQVLEMAADSPFSGEAPEASQQSGCHTGFDCRSAEVSGQGLA
jgi:hypothetical protein